MWLPGITVSSVFRVRRFLLALSLSFLCHHTWSPDLSGNEQNKPSPHKRKGLGRNFVQKGQESGLAILRF